MECVKGKQRERSGHHLLQKIAANYGLFLGRIPCPLCHAERITHLCVRAERGGLGVVRLASTSANVSAARGGAVERPRRFQAVSSHHHGGGSPSVTELLPWGAGEALSSGGNGSRAPVKVSTIFPPPALGSGRDIWGHPVRGCQAPCSTRESAGGVCLWP